MGWNSWLQILKQQREEARIEASRIPVACPNDGTPLREGPQGQLFCPWDGWQPQR